MAKYYYNGVLLPEIPADAISEYPYAVIVEDTTTGEYYLTLKQSPSYYSNQYLLEATVPRKTGYLASSEETEWVMSYSDTSVVNVYNPFVLCWSNHDIPNGSATATEIYFSGSDPVPEETEEPETVTQYLIRSDTLTAIADRIREMAGTNKKLTPADIIYWLGRVKFIPQGWSTSEFTLDFDCGASGVLPVVVKGTASSEFTLNFESSAVGALQEG